MRSGRAEGGTRDAAARAGTARAGRHRKRREGGGKVKRTILASWTVAVIGVMVWMPAAVAQWSIGTRVEYVTLGGEQFDEFTGGVGVNGFLAVPVSSRGRLELGVSVTRHDRYLLCLSFHPCQPTAPALMSGLYVQPTLQMPVSRALAVYAGPRAGVLAGGFQDGTAGVEVGGVGGLRLVVAAWLGLDAGLGGSMVYLGDPPAGASRGRFGRRLAWRLGGVLTP